VFAELQLYLSSEGSIDFRIQSVINLFLKLRDFRENKVQFDESVLVADDQEFLALTLIREARSTTLAESAFVCGVVNAAYPLQRP
jgi:hypothetical protein